MKVMAIVKATRASEAGELPSTELLAAMGKYNEELAEAGILLAGEGLQPSSKGARITFSPGGPVVTDGPFAETKELIAGFWIIRAKSLQEAKEWMSRAPMHPDAVLEIRQVFENEDFGDTLSPEIAKQEDAWREKAGYAR